MSLRDHKVYVHKIEYDQQHAYCAMNEVHPIDKWTRVKDEVVLIAPDDEEIAKAQFEAHARYRYKNMRLINTTKLDIDGYLHDEIY